MAFEFLFGGFFALLLMVFFFFEKKEFWTPAVFAGVLFIGNVFLFALAGKIGIGRYNGFFLCVLVILNGVAITFAGGRKKRSLSELFGALISVFGFVSLLYANAFARETVQLANWVNGFLR